MDRVLRGAPVLRIALALFVLAWILGPYELRTAVPVWIAFLIALGLELQFFISGLRAAPYQRPDRRPQGIDRERYGYESEADELLLVREGGQEFWIPYSGESEEELEALIAEAREPSPEPPEEEPPALDEGRDLWPPLRRLLTGLAVIAALAAVIWVVEERTGWDSLGADTRAEAAARFSEAASQVAAKPVTIRCDEAGDYVGAVQHADGVAAIGDDLAYLSPERCLDLYRLAFEGEVRSSQTGRAIAVLAHEAWHLRGERDEATTECLALQSGVRVGRELGLSEGTARRLMRQQLAENALRAGSSPEYLVGPECRDGGRLDLNPNSTRFP